MKTWPIVVLLLLFIAGCQANEPSADDLQTEAERVAQEFSIRISKGDFEAAYYLFVPISREMRSKEAFVAYAEAKNDEINLYYDRVFVSNEEEAFAYYTGQIGILEAKLEPIEMHYVESEGWRIDAFAGYFTDQCAESCSERHACEEAKCDEGTGFLCSRKTLSVCECQSSSSCPVSKPNCLGGQCVQDECLSDDHCSNGKLCYNGECVSCYEDNHCWGQKPYCYQNRCVTCKYSSDCPENLPHCVYDKDLYGNPETHCAECNSRDHCDEGQTCTNGRCWPPD